MAVATPNTGPAGAELSPDAVARQVLAALAVSVGRFQSPEQWQSQDVVNQSTTPQQMNIARPMPLSRPAESIVLLWAGRITVANANMTAVAPEAPWSLLQQFQLTGQHEKYGSLQPIRMTGATMGTWPQLFQRGGNYLQINGFRAADATVPYVSPFLGNVGTYDVIMVWNIPLGPLVGLGQSAKRDLASYLYQAPDWGDTIQAQLNWGDVTALGTPTTAGDVTLTAFGSATGNPTTTLFVNYSIMGPFSEQPTSGVIVRQEQFFNQFTSVGTNLRITQLQKQITTGIVLKSGLLQGTVTSGVQVFASLDETILNRTQIMVDNKPLKFNQSNNAMRGYLDRMFGNDIPGGYFMTSFVEAQSPSVAFRGDGLAGGASFELNSDVTIAQSNVIGMTQEMVYGGPFPDLRSR
jgi:hypothetical protein